MRLDNVKGHLDLLLLSVLADGPAHGYAVITALRERSEGAFDLTEGSVYPALHRLEDRGLLSSEWQPVSGRRRRLYRLTRDGRAALAVEHREWNSLAAAVHSVIGGGGRSVVRTQVSAPGGAL